MFDWIRGYLGRDRPEWTDHYVGGAVTLVDGTTAQGCRLMRRRVGGRWQYRRMTDEEYVEDAKNRQW